MAIVRCLQEGGKNMLNTDNINIWNKRKKGTDREFLDKFIFDLFDFVDFVDFFDIAKR